MGYYATGGGSVNLMQEVPEEVMDVIKETFSDFGVDGDELWITFEDCKYYDDVDDCMRLLAPYAKSGDVYFSGEDDCHWRFHFCNGKVEEQNGEVEYKGGKRTFNVCYYHSEGSNEAQFDIDDDDFAVMMNELIALTRQVADESNEQNIEIYRIEEVPYDGE